MEDVKIILSALWVATMFNNLYGDVLMILSGDTEKIFANQAKFTQAMWLVIAIIMATPVVMIVLSTTLNHPLVRWINIIVAIFWIVFNCCFYCGFGFDVCSGVHGKKEMFGVGRVGLANSQTLFSFSE